MTPFPRPQPLPAWPRLLACVLGSGLLLHCDYFPESLLDGSVENDAPDGSVAAFALAETCVGDVPMVTDDLDNVPIDLTTLSDDISDIGFCTGADAPGNDGFFGVQMEAGEKWHFHLRTVSEDMRNPAIYVLDSSCDSRRCMAGDAIDVCGEGRDEHLSFVAPRAGLYYVGIDSRVVGGAMYQLVALRPVCGNDDVEHSETCDDGNTESGDGCDATCRHELPHPMTGMAEAEPNDDPTGANRIVAGTGNVTGRLGGRCDTDLFSFDVEEGTNVNVALRGAGGVACPVGTPTFSLQLLAANATSLVAAGNVPDGENCPVLTATGLTAGTYYVSVTTDENERPFDYTLAVTQP